MKNILITGGAGFIGSNFCAYLHQHRPELALVVLDKLTYAGNRKNLDEIDCTFIHGDICDTELVEKVVNVHQIDTIVNFAAETHNDNSLREPKQFIESNILGVYSLLEVCRKYNLRFHHISTDEVYGDLALDSDNKFTEDTPYNPTSPYSASKASSDLLVSAWYKSFGVACTISNCSNNFGPRQHIEKFIPRQITNGILGMNMKLYGDGLNVRDWIHVDDHSSAVLFILEHGKIGETYLIGCNNTLNNKQIVEQLAKFFPEVAIEYVRDRTAHDRKYAIDASKLLSLGWSPEKKDFDILLEDTVKWYQGHSDYWITDKQTVENNYKKFGQ